jgi:hypothetical protein
MKFKARCLTLQCNNKILIICINCNRIAVSNLFLKKIPNLIGCKFLMVIKFHELYFFAISSLINNEHVLIKNLKKICIRFLICRSL